jgi:hypothetical protein
MTQEEEIEFDRLKTARDSLLLTVADLRGQLETIAAKEREACAKVCESQWGKGYRDDDGGDAWLTHDNAVHACAAAIRERGEA